MASLLRVSEAARILHVHGNTLRRWSDQGIIKAYRFGQRGDRRFREDEIARFQNMARWKKGVQYGDDNQN